MTAVTKRLDQAIQAASTLPADQQDMLAEELLDMIQDLFRPPYKLTQEEHAELNAAMWRRHVP